MPLPNLPKQHKKKEADFGVTFRHWIESNHPNNDCAFELKHTRGKSSLPFCEVKEEQIIYANNIKNGVLIRIQGLQGEPDYIWIKGKVTYVVIKYPHSWYVILMDTFLQEKDTSNRKSLTEECASTLAVFKV